MKDLTAKQAAFVKEYLIDLNATQAAIRAGYSAKTAQEQSSRLLSNAIIRENVQKAMDERSETVGLTAADVLRDINAVKADAMRKTYDKEGNEVMANHTAALKALELQGKHLKMFTDKIETTGANGGPIESKFTIDPKSLSSDLLKELIRARASANKE
ncbi:XtmA Phage terminase, small subunit [uncultured Caudovirales phage]|uniref:XtmA Phage terminase, small subunit n=1 Tax=uncultured Caudovirales phage TaxID=2100421 RepID=A0A6J5L2J4_9CAUD|nr:XtmA Phage terminase, small subunit [uncultured Caudovirales phage]